MDLTYDRQLELRKILDNYKNIETFVKESKRPTYVQFDYSVVHGLTLFMIEPELGIEELEIKINEIISTIPSIKRIFAQPFIHLRERDVILPTESVRIINNNTIQHISSHSELWTDIKSDGIKPSKLLTRTYDDNYGIYENLVFCQTIDDILSFTRINSRFFKELIYTNQTVEINLLERVNHLNYFLALGKLHIGYSRSFEAYYPAAARCLNKLQYISGSIIPRLKRAVYKNNRIRPAQIKLRKTNILSMHKDYHQIYKLAKNFAQSKPAAIETVTEKDVKRLQKNYFYFCEALCVFSIGHFNFECDENKPIDFARLCMKFTFKGWKLTLKKQKFGERQLLNLRLEKNVKYSVIIIPSELKDNDELLESVKANVEGDEYVVFTPYEDVEDATTVDITSLESFRRIQQILLRAMILSDSDREECPFCNGKLTLNEEKSAEDRPVYECLSCRTEIYRGYCPETEKHFYYTKISGLTNGYADADDWLTKRKREAQTFFRNITELDENFEPVCPYCRKKHK